MTSPLTTAEQGAKSRAALSRSGSIRTWRRASTAIVGVASLVVGLAIVTPGTAAVAATGCGVAANPIVCENALPGTNPTVWDIDGAGDDSIQGFSTDISVNVGATIGFKVDTSASAYTIQIFRTGYYQGLGARKVATVTPSASLPQKQPQCVTDATTEIYDCGNWALSASSDGTAQEADNAPLAQS